MRLHHALALGATTAIALTLGACATTPDSPAPTATPALAATPAPANNQAMSLPEGFFTQVVMAHNAALGRGPMGVSDRFTLDGKIVAYVTLNWTDLHAPWGAQKFETRWYAGDRLVKRSESEFNIDRAPFQIWSANYPAALGPGKGHVEMYWNNQKIAERAFEIIDNTAPRPAMPPTALRPS